MEPPGGVDDDDVPACLARGVEAALDRLDRVLRVGAVDGDLDLAAELLELVDRGGALQVGRDECRLLPSLRSLSASFADVVLPEPWSPAIRITVGGLPNASRESPEPIRFVSSSCTIFTTCWPASSPSGRPGRSRAPDLGDELLDDLEVDVGLEQREPDLAHRLRDRLLVEAALAAQVAEGVLELL